jgi:hypothetical protein
MTTPKIETVSIDGRRFYKHPTQKHLKVPSVTSVLDMLPAPYLRKWNSKITAESAVQNLEHVNELASKSKTRAIEWLKGAPDRELEKAGTMGDRVHKILEDLINDPLGTVVEDDLMPYVDGFYQFCDRFEPEWLFIERPIFSVTHLYAGSFDAICKIKDKNYMLDFKTTRSGISSKVAMQLAAYARADIMFDDENNEVELPEIHAGAALWLRPDKWAFQPLRIDDDVFHTFLSLRRVFEWEQQRSKTAMLAPVANKSLL